MSTSSYSSFNLLKTQMFLILQQMIAHYKKSDNYRDMLDKIDSTADSSADDVIIKDISKVRIRSSLGVQVWSPRHPLSYSYSFKQNVTIPHPIKHIPNVLTSDNLLIYYISKVMLFQISENFKRSFKNIIRNPMYTKTRIMQSLVGICKFV